MEEDFLEHKASLVDIIAEALGVTVDPHQTFVERLMDTVKAYPQDCYSDLEAWSGHIAELVGLYLGLPEEKIKGVKTIVKRRYWMLPKGDIVAFRFKDAEGKWRNWNTDTHLVEIAKGMGYEVEYARTEPK